MIAAFKCMRTHYQLVVVSCRTLAIRADSGLPLNDGKVEILGKQYPTDHMTNVTPNILSHLQRNLYLKKYHPLCHLHQRIVQFMHGCYRNKRGNPLFSVYDRLPPVVSINQNFDSLLVPFDHVCREKSDNYYINQECLLRAHTTAHQSDLIKTGLNNFLIVGDVYRRDDIDTTHYPVFHQMDAVRLCSKDDVFGMKQNIGSKSLFENGVRSDTHQGVHSQDALQHMSNDLKQCLEGLATAILGQGVEMRWVDSYFPFTHPSWELEIRFEDEWVEMLGCGIIEQEILSKAGAGDKIGWAFGLGLERWAMKLYEIPDIRLFWSRDSGVLSQFEFDDPNTQFKFKVVSRHAHVINDISFWIPNGGSLIPADFYDLVRSIGGQDVEQVKLIDVFKHPKKEAVSHCYRIMYRNVDHQQTKEEVNGIHHKIENAVVDKFNVKIR